MAVPCYKRQLYYTIREIQMAHTALSQIIEKQSGFQNPFCLISVYSVTLIYLTLSDSVFNKRLNSTVGLGAN